MNKDTINSILLRRKQRIIVFKEDQDTRLASFQRIYGFNEELRSLGYILSGQLMVEMMKLRCELFDEYEANIITTLKEMTGSDVEHKPMYRNCPESVKKSRSSTFFIPRSFMVSTDKGEISMAHTSSPRF